MNIDNIFNTQNSVCSDECWKLSKDNQNDEIGKYYTYNTNNEPCVDSKVRMPDFYLSHENLRGKPGYGIDACSIDQYNNLVNNKELMTQDKCKLQVFERLFTACPSIKSSLGDIDKELDVLSGTDTNPFKCKKSIMELPTYKFTPMLDCVKEIQNHEHIVPNWINGGENTRDFINRQNFNKKC